MAHGAGEPCSRARPDCLTNRSLVVVCTCVGAARHGRTDKQQGQHVGLLGLHFRQAAHASKGTRLLAHRVTGGRVAERGLNVRRIMVVVCHCVAAEHHGRADIKACTYCRAAGAAPPSSAPCFQDSRHAVAAAVRTCPPATMWSSLPGQLGLVRLRRATHSLMLPSGWRT